MQIHMRLTASRGSSAEDVQRLAALLLLMILLPPDLFRSSASAMPHGEPIHMPSGKSADQCLHSRAMASSMKLADPGFRMTANSRKGLHISPAHAHNAALLNVDVLMLAGKKCTAADLLVGNLLGQAHAC